MSKEPCVGLFGGTRYSYPLSRSTAKKFEALKAVGEFHVIAFAQTAWPRRFNEHASFYLLPKFPLPVLRYATAFLLGPPMLWWLVWRRRIEILVAQSPYEGAVCAFVKLVAAALGRRLALVVESQGDFERSLFLQRRVRWSGLYHRLMRYTARFALRHADVLRAVSRAGSAQLKTMAGTQRVFVFPTWTDIELFFGTGNQQDDGAGDEILYVGVLTPLKGVHHLIAAFARIANEFTRARLVVVGDDENAAYAADLRRRVATSGMSDRIQFTGLIPAAEVASWMCKACVVVLPSYAEGLPRVLLEAMAAGRPVIASAVGGIPELVQHGTNGLLTPPGDETALTRHLRWVLSHSPQAEEMGAQARADVRQRYSTPTYVRNYSAMLAAAAASRGDPATDAAPVA